MKKSEVLTDTPVTERITAEIKAVSAKKALKALVLEREKVREVKRLTSKRQASRNKGCGWIDDSAVDDLLYNNSSNYSMDFEYKPPTSNFQFDTKKVKAGDYILIELESKKGNPVHCIITTKKEAAEELKVHFLKETGVRLCAN